MLWQITQCVWDGKMPVIELFIVAGLASEEEAEEGTSVSPSMTEVWLCQLSTAW